MIRKDSMTQSSRTAMQSDAAAQRYERRQTVRWLTLVAAAIGAAVAVVPHSDPPSRLATVAVAVLGLSIGFLSAMLLVVDDETVRWYVGGKGGWPRGHIPLIRIERVEAIELGFFEGWRAHWTIWQGWRWDVRRFRAVEITTRDGTRTILGTGAPDALCNAIDERRRLPA